jgi:hypothetical protein
MCEVPRRLLARAEDAVVAGAVGRMLPAINQPRLGPTSREPRAAGVEDAADRLAFRSLLEEGEVVAAEADLAAAPCKAH